MNKELLYSKEYTSLFGTPWAERHNDKMRLKYGVWRWAGMIENRDLIMDEIMINAPVIDFGGAKGPLGFDSYIVDQEKFTPVGHFVPFKSLTCFHNGSIGVIFSSHCLEHIKEISTIIHLIYEKLMHGGKAIIHVPSSLGAEYWHPQVKKEHEWIFCMKNDTNRDFKHTLPIDVLFSQAGFEIDLCQHVGDCSLLMMARKK